MENDAADQVTQARPGKAQTRIVMPVQNLEGKGSVSFMVQEPFNVVISRLTPSEQPDTVLGVRANLTFLKDDGKQVFITPPQAGWWAEEL